MRSALSAGTPGRVQKLEATRFSWDAGVFKSGWKQEKAGIEDVTTWSWWTLSKLPRDAQNENVKVRFKKLFDTFPAWQRAISRNDSLIELKVDPKCSDIPWEAGLAAPPEGLNLRHAGIVRVLHDEEAQQTSAKPGVPTEIRTVVLRGNPSGGPDGQDLNLKYESDLIENGWINLSNATKQIAKLPKCFDVSVDNFRQIIQLEKPHVLIFSGHGDYQKDDVALGFNGEAKSFHWVKSSEFASMIQGAGCVPKYVIFWACSTGQTNFRKGIPSPPSLFLNLRNIGVEAVVAMQSVVSDDGAIILSESFFNHIACGTAIEIALARSRMELMKRYEGANSRLMSGDWAAPVIWSKGASTSDRWWLSEDFSPLLAQFFGKITLALSANPSDSLRAIKNPALKFPAGDLGAAQRIWIGTEITDSDFGSENVEVRAFLNHVQNNLNDSAILLLALNPKEDIKTALVAWAQDILGRLSFEMQRNPIADLLPLFDKPQTVESAWEALCEKWQFAIALICPPKLEEKWFWNPLLKKQAKIIIFSPQSLEGDQHKDWEVDTMAAQALEKEEIQKAVNECSRLAKAMAVLNVPVRSRYLRLGEEKLSIENWASANLATIDIGPGRILTSRTRTIVMDQIQAESALAAARQDALLILANGPREVRLVSRRLSLYLEDFQNGEQRALLPLLDDVTFLLLHYRDQRQSMLALQLTKSLPIEVRRLLSTESRRAAGWAYLQQGLPNEALLLLNTASADPIENSDRLRLRAEANKNLKRWSEAIEQLEAARSACQRVPEGNSNRDTAYRISLECENDLIRMRHFSQVGNDSERVVGLSAAKGEYEGLVDKWNQFAPESIQRAIVLRNLGECFRDLANLPTPNTATLRIGATERLKEALDILPKDRANPLKAEILYELSKVQRDEFGYRAEQERQLVVQALEAAKAAAHGFLIAIMECGDFWMQGPFSFETWETSKSRWREIDLKLLAIRSHGWPARKYVDAHLKVANIMTDAGDWEKASEELSLVAAQMEITELSLYGSDLGRTIRFKAGDNIVKRALRTNASNWQTFVESSAAVADWLEARKLNTPEAVWASIII